MIKVTVEIIPGGQPNHPRRATVATLLLANDGESADPKRGNYFGRSLRKGTQKTQREGKVKNWPRQSRHVFCLVRQMLQNMGY